MLKPIRKCQFVLPVLLMVCVYTSAQTEQSSTDKFLRRSGVFLSESYVDVGVVKVSLGELRVRAMSAAEINTGNKISGIEVGYIPNDKKYGGINVKIDVDEVDLLISSMEIMQTKIFATRPAHFTQTSLSTRSGLQVGCIGGGSTFPTTPNAKWLVFVNLRINDDKYNLFIEQAEFNELLKMLHIAKKNI